VCRPANPVSPAKALLQSNYEQSDAKVRGIVETAT
jgi:hypothetical protein